MNDVKALILCNNPIALPGIREFLFYGKVAGMATPARNKEMQHLLKDSGVPLLPVNRKNYREELASFIRTEQVNVCLLMTFPYIISKELLALPEKGFINFHFGLLPGCRGPQPILMHLLNNDREAGITVHKVDEGIDTGPIIMQERVLIEETDTYGTLQTKLAYLAAKQAANLLKILSFGTILPATPQDETKANYYEMPTAAALTIRWEEMTAAEIVRLVNACNPWNKGAGAHIGEWFIGITEAIIAGEAANDATAPGTIMHCDSENGLVVRTKDAKRLKISIVFTNEGFFSGSRMSLFGIEAGMRFS